jgi:O-acetyl-ADP-ribose deacetylase (regulator of RNase III)
MNETIGYHKLPHAEAKQLLAELVAGFAEERDEQARTAGEVDDLFAEFRALVNTRPPAEADPDLLQAQDRLLTGMVANRGIADISNTEPSPHDGRLSLWRGDITAFRADAIVNAANSQMLGCWVPGHKCIDNAIHTFAGVQLRLECAELMRAQGHEEPTGAAKITSGWNLPAKHIIHTVGPICMGQVTDRNRAALVSCYRSCLECACENGLESIAFCGISTGVFGFPVAEAAPIAVDAVSSWLDETGSALRVVFDVFTDEEERCYRKALGL